VIGILNIWKINGVKMKNKDFFFAMLISLLVGLTIVGLTNKSKKELTTLTITDTTSQDFYKKSLDSFFFDHSKIPDE
jgi:hypothetical protein